MCIYRWNHRAIYKERLLVYVHIVLYVDLQEMFPIPPSIQTSLCLK